MDVSFTAREGSENCQALSRCTTIIWIIGSQPVWQRLTEARVQFPDPLPTAPHPQPCLPHVGYQERKDAEHPQVCCTQNNLYRTMYLLPGRLRGRESPGLRPGGGAWEQPFSWPANGKRASLGGWAGSTAFPTHAGLFARLFRSRRRRESRQKEPKSGFTFSISRQLPVEPLFSLFLSCVRSWLSEQRFNLRHLLPL